MNIPANNRLDSRLYQFTVENLILDDVKNALRRSLASDEDRLGAERKISMVKFVTESLVRHLRRLLELEDEAEAADPIAEFKPHLADKATALQNDHCQFRTMLDELSEQVENLVPGNETYYSAFSREMLAFLDRLDEHEQAELEMLQEVHNSDEGGEG